MYNYFGVVQRHIGSNAIYNYNKNRQRLNTKVRKHVLKIYRKGNRNPRVPIVKNNKYLNKNSWGKIAIGVHMMK